MAALADRGLPNPVADCDEAVAASANRILWGVTEAAKKIGVDCATVYAKTSIRPTASSRRPRKEDAI
jgi:hypothetical protein